MLSYAAATNKEGYPKVVRIWDERNGSGGDAVNGSWGVRDLNTIDNSQFSSITLSSNQFTLPGGYRYQICVDAPFYSLARALCRIFSTDTEVDKRGSVEYGQPGGAIASVRSMASLNISLSGSKTFEIQYFCTESRDANGLGVGADEINPEIFTQVTIWVLGEI